MAKQLNSSTGKGWFVAQGQSSVEALLSGGTSQKELAKLAGLFTGDPPKPNAGAVSNILKSLGWGSFNGQAPVVTEKKISAPVVTTKVVAKPAKAELPLPGRLEAYFEYRLGWDMNYPIQAHHVELLILADDVAWNQLALKFGPEEIAMIGAFLESGGYCPVARISQRGQWLAEKSKVAAAKRIAESISAVLAIDARLNSQRERFESSRYDADITDFYME